VWPIGSSDLFTYINRSRVLTEYHANPYLIHKNLFSQDDYYPWLYTEWSFKPIVYGPVFVLFSSIITLVSNNNILFSLLLFKFIFVLLNLLIIFILYKITKSKKAIFLYAWNPLLLFEFIANGHNDILIILFLLGSLYFFINKNGVNYTILAWLLMLFSVLVKYTTLIYLPVFFLLLLFTSKDKRTKLQFTISAALLAIVIPVMLFLPFWQGIQTLSPVGRFTNNVYFYSAIGMNAISGIIFSIANVYSLPFSLNTIFNLGEFISKGIFTLFYLWLLFRLYKTRANLRKERVVDYLIYISLAFFLLAINWLMPWHLTALIALLILWMLVNKKSGALYFIQAMTFYGIIIYAVLR
jgi:hypothetical protein